MYGMVSAGRTKKQKNIKHGALTFDPACSCQTLIAHISSVANSWQLWLSGLLNPVLLNLCGVRVG